MRRDRPRLRPPIARRCQGLRRQTGQGQTLPARRVL